MGHRCHNKLESRKLTHVIHESWTNTSPHNVVDAYHISVVNGLLLMKLYMDGSDAVPKLHLVNKKLTCIIH